jgi:hypothetical protein
MYLYLYYLFIFVFICVLIYLFVCLFVRVSISYLYVYFLYLTTFSVFISFCIIFHLFLLIINLFIHLCRYLFTYLTPHPGRFTFVLPYIPCIECWVVPRVGMDGCGKPRPSPAFNPLTVQLVAGRYTDSFVPAHRCILTSILLAYGTDRLSRNVGTYQSKLRNIPEEGRSLFHHSRSLKPRTIK